MNEVTIHPDKVKEAFHNSTERFHAIYCWMGIILNIVWFISDYFVLPDHWIPFLEFRLAVSLITLSVLTTRRITGISIYATIFLFVLGVSIQNAYMWSVMDLAHLQKHAFAYLILFIGVGMLMLWDIWYSVVLVVATVIANIVFYEMNSPLSVQEFTINGGLLILTVAIFSLFLIRTRYNLTLNEIRSRLELERSKEIIEEEHNVVMTQKKELSEQKDVLQDKNKEITDSINYAKRIQNAFITSETEFNKFFHDSFVLFRPKDIVSGDFYWVYKKGDKIYYATGDCTGHGVPGGFMTMIGLSFLDELIEGKNSDNPAEVLNGLREKIINTLKQGANSDESKDGMDITLCCLDKKTYTLKYAAANNSFYIIRNNELIELKGDKQPCGFFPDPKPFTSHEYKLEKGDCIYTLTDGYPDQFGGKKGKKFRYRQLEELFEQNHQKPFAEQKQILNETMNEWIGSLDQVDDMLLIGVKIE